MNFFISFLHAGFDDRPVTIEIQTRQKENALMMCRGKKI